MCVICLLWSMNSQLIDILGLTGDSVIKFLISSGTVKNCRDY